MTTLQKLQKLQNLEKEFISIIIQNDISRAMKIAYAKDLYTIQEKIKTLKTY